MTRAFCILLAGGTGSRMGGALPKQFLPLKGVPIIIRTLRRVLECRSFAAVVVAIHPEWEEDFRALLPQYAVDESRIVVVHGGAERHDSILNALKAARRHFDVTEADVVVVHDAVRPFVSRRVLDDSVAAAAEHGACVAACPAVDTMLVVRDGMVVEVPKRSELYNGQAPDSARLLSLERAIESLSADERRAVTGTAQICVLKGIPVKAIKGDPDNIKITTPHDLEVGERIVESQEGNDEGAGA